MLSSLCYPSRTTAEPGSPNVGGLHRAGGAAWSSKALGWAGSSQWKQLAQSYLGLGLSLSLFGPGPCKSHVLRRCRLWIPCRLGSGVGSPAGHGPPGQDHSQVKVNLGSGLLQVGLLLEGHLLRKSMYNHSSLPDIPPTQGPPIIWVSSGSS